MNRVLAYCKQHTLKKKGPFEIYSGEKVSQIMVIVNSRQENEPLKHFKPLGTFYCNYLGEGIISLDQKETDYDAVPSAKKHEQLLKQVIDILIEKARPGVDLYLPI
jgi:hypothetical protein